MLPAELKSIRLAMGLTQAELAQALQVSGGGTIYRWESGTRKIPGPVATALAYMLARRGISSM